MAEPHPSFEYEVGERLDVSTPVSRGEGQKDFFVKIGAAWVNRDGSFNVNLDALPTNGKLHIRRPQTNDAPE